MKWTIGVELESNGPTSSEDELVCEYTIDENSHTSRVHTPPVAAIQILERDRISSGIRTAATDNGRAGRRIGYLT